MTLEYIRSEMEKAGLRAFKRYIQVICMVSYETFLEWDRKDQEELLQDFFDG